MNPPISLGRTIRESYLKIYLPSSACLSKCSMLEGIRYFRRLRYHFGDRARLSPGKGNRAYRRMFAIRGYGDGYRLNALGLLRCDGAYQLGL